MSSVQVHQTVQMIIIVILFSQIVNVLRVCSVY